MEIPNVVVEQFHRFSEVQKEILVFQEFGNVLLSQPLFFYAFEQMQKKRQVTIELCAFSPIFNYAFISLSDNRNPISNLFL
jgi:hypothetical protein